MPRRLRRRANRPKDPKELDPDTIASLKRELPPWLAEFLLYRTHPLRGTAAAALLDQLMEGWPPKDQPLSKIWKHHRTELLARWEAEGHLEHLTEPYAARCYDRDPYNPDPRELLGASE